MIMSNVLIIEEDRWIAREKRTNSFGFGAFLTQLDAVFVILQYVRAFSNTL